MKYPPGFNELNVSNHVTPCSSSYKFAASQSEIRSYSLVMLMLSVNGVNMAAQRSRT
jgi:hypothetical protein